MKRIPLSLIALFLGLAIDLSAQVNNQVFVGARPLGMGETFVAIADDGNAIYWNPAGLPSIDHYSLYGVHANLYNTGVSSNYVSFFLPFTERLTFGVDWFGIGFEDDQLNYSDNKFNLAVGYKVFDQLSLGFNLKHLRYEGTYFGLPQDNGSNPHGQGFGADFGLLFSPWRQLRLGMMAHDVSDSKIKHNGGGTEVIQPRNVRLGAAYQFLPNLLVAADLDDRVHLGSELWLANFFALRAGWQKDRYTDEGATYAFGAGFERKFGGLTFRLDYAYTIPPSLPDMSSFSGSFVFDLFAPLVKIEKVEIEPVYASLYKHYSENPFGTAKINYKGKEPLKCEISVAVPGYARPYLHDLSLATATDSVTMNIDFSQQLLSVEEKSRLNAEVTITYFSDRRPRQAKRSTRFDLFPLNKLDWSRGSAQVAAFIDHEDSDVDAVAQKFLAGVPAADFLIDSSPITIAQQLFEGLGYFGITYRPDKYLPFASAHNSVDNVFYPFQLLEKKQGDCDDLTVLYAALLENRSIPVALVFVPKHIFLMFDTGIHESKKGPLRLPQEMYQIYNERVWIPVEVTAVGRSFDEAWESGANLFQQYAANQDTEIVKVRQAWSQYESVKLPKNLRQNAPMAREALQPFQTVRRIRQRQEAYLNGLEQQVTQNPNQLELRNELGLIYGQSKEFAKAEKHLRAAIALDAKNFMAHNNLANVYFWQGKLDSAKAKYEKALAFARTKDDSAGAQLNLGTLYFAAGNDTVAHEFYASAIRDSADVRKAGRLLGIDFDAVRLRASSTQQVKKVSEYSVEEQISSLLAKPKGKKPPKTNPKPTGIRNNRIPDTQIDDVFYWAQ
jgi:hypothetical protein